MSSDLSKIDPRQAWQPYVPDTDRPWNRARAAHLYRRAGFAATWDGLEAALKQEPAKLVAKLVRGPKTDEAFEQQSRDLSEAMLATGNPRNLSVWWLHRMIGAPHPLLEKTTLFWHSHFATSAAKVTDARLMFDQHKLLRQHALGKLGPLVQAISRDPAMLIYLDSTTNRKLRPNENYARELMELFCLGEGNYSEQDIKQVARAFTGWEVRGGRFRFNKFQHDELSKSFLGKSGNFGGEQAVRIVLAQPAAAEFIAGKLFRFFVCDEPSPPAALIGPLAEQLRRNDFTIGPLIERILSSRLFFSAASIGRKIRSPVELGVGLLRALGGATNVYQLAEELAQIGQAVFFPPNVKGWEGGRHWINTSTLLGRANLVGRLVGGNETNFADGDLAKLAERCGATSPEEIVDWLLECLVAVPIPEKARQPLVKLAGSTGGDASERVGKVIHAMSLLPEFQLG